MTTVKLHGMIDTHLDNLHIQKLKNLAVREMVGGGGGGGCFALKSVKKRVGGGGEIKFECKNVLLK
jgi:hypothetical protein